MRLGDCWFREPSIDPSLSERRMVHFQPRIIEDSVLQPWHFDDVFVLERFFKTQKTRKVTFRRKLSLISLGLQNTSLSHYPFIEIICISFDSAGAPQWILGPCEWKTQWGPCLSDFTSGGARRWWWWRGAGGVQSSCSSGVGHWIPTQNWFRLTV